MDTVGVGGTSPLALRIDAPGITVWAIQTRYDAYEDTLHRSEPADLWALSGDRLRFPDGRPIPARVGQIRAMDSVGVVVIDHGDDGTGSYIVRCRYPALAIVVDNVWLYGVGGRTMPLARVSPADTTPRGRIEVTPHHVDAAARTACAGRPTG